MIQKQHVSTCPTRDLLLRGEVLAWAGYWIVLSERTALQDEVFRLKEAAFGATNAVQDHVANCVVCGKSRIKLYYLPEAHVAGSKGR